MTRIEWTIDNRAIWGEVWTDTAVASLEGRTIPITDGLERNTLGHATIVTAQIRDSQIWLTLDIEGEDALRALRSPVSAAVTTTDPHTLHELYGDPTLTIEPFRMRP